MHGIPKMMTSTLNKSVTLVGSKQVLGNRYFLLNVPFDIKISFTGATEYRTKNLHNMLTVENSFIYSKTVLRDSKYCVQWCFKEVISTSILRFLLNIRLHNNYFRYVCQEITKRADIDLYNDTLSEQTDKLEPLADELAKKLLKIAKVDKDNISSIKDTVRAMAFFYQIENEEDIIKELNTKANNASKILYTYVTDKHIPQHYKAIKKALKMHTCMTKGVKE